MTGAVLVALAILVSAGAVALAGAQLRRVTRVAPPDLRPFARRLRGLPAHERFLEVVRRSREERSLRAGDVHWLARMAEAFEASDADARTAALNEVLGEIHELMDRGAAWPRAAVRIAALGGLALAAGAVLAESRPPLVLAIVGVGASGALLSAVAAGVAARRAEAQRLAVDALVDALVGGGPPRALDRPRGRMYPAGNFRPGMGTVALQESAVPDVPRAGSIRETVDASPEA